MIGVHVSRDDGCGFFKWVPHEALGLFEGLLDPESDSSFQYPEHWYLQVVPPEALGLIIVGLLVPESDSGFLFPVCSV